MEEMRENGLEGGPWECWNAVRLFHEGARGVV
jgi:hypothetical protein